MRRILFSFLVAGSPAAFADSFCGYEAGIVGTKGVGFLSPYRVESANLDYDQKRCQVSVFLDSESSSSTVMDCTLIEEFPSQNNRLVLDEDPIFMSEYFAFLVYEWRDNQARIRTREGEYVWVNARYVDPYDKFGPEDVIGVRGLKTSKNVYRAPDTAQIAPAEYIKGSIPQEYLMRLFEYAGVPFAIPEKRWDWFFEKKDPGSFYFEFSYHVTDLVEDASGALWYVADEHLAVEALMRDEREHELVTILGEPIDGIYYSPVIRTVFIPYRDHENRIQAVFWGGPYCD